MKKLLLASIIMMGFSGVAKAQTTDAAAKAKKEEARKQTAQPTFTNAAGESTAPSAVATDKVKLDAEVITEKNAVVKAKEATPAKTEKTDAVKANEATPAKTEKTAAKKAKQN